MTRTEMIDFIKHRLESSSDTWLMDDTDKFPNPPTEIEWQLLIEDLRAAGEIKSHPNGRYFLPKENPPSRQINFHGQGIYNEQSNQGNQSLSDNALTNPATQNIKKNSAANKPKTSILQIIYWVVGILVALTVLYAFLNNE
jgi:hypothetical protein